MAAKCRVVTRFRNTLGLPGGLSVRLQPNHPTDDARGIAASVLDGLLRMRNRFLRFASIRPEHVYRLDDLGDAPFAAPWAKAASRAQRGH